MPALEDREVFGREMSRIVRQVQAAGAATGPTRLTLHIRMLVTRDGDVAHASLSRRSSRSDVDREVLQFARRLRFHPARARGVPVDVWVEQPLQVDLPPPRRTP
jgi:TonB family protein